MTPGFVDVFGMVTSLLPHRQVSLPYRADPSIVLSVYADSELGYLLNVYEPKVVDVFQTLAEDVETVIDVGGHIGIYTLLALARGCKVYTFEPHPENVERIEAHITQNDFEGRAAVIPAAVSNVVDEAALAVHDSPTQHSLSGGGSGQSLQVPTTTLDSHPQLRGVTPDLVKIDVEGAGAAVLEGATRLHRESKAIWIIELHNDKERAAVRRAFDNPRYTIMQLDADHVLVKPTGSS